MVVHILANMLSDDNRNRFQRQCETYGAQCLFHQVNESRLEGCQYRTKVHPLSSAAYYRILLASILEEVSRVIYLDCDMIVRSDLSQAFGMNLGGNGVAAVEDYDTPVDMEHYRQLGLNDGDKYFNSGFMVIDLDYWRQHNTEQQLLQFAKRKRKVYFHDQDALNCVFRTNWQRLARMELLQCGTDTGGSSLREQGRGTSFLLIPESGAFPWTLFQTLARHDVHPLSQGMALLSGEV